MNMDNLVNNNTKKANHIIKPQYYSTTRNYQEILSGFSNIKPVSERIKEFIKVKFARL